MKNVTVKIPELVLSNPEDVFNDLIAEGYTVREALFQIIEDELLEQELQNKYPDFVPETVDRNDVTGVYTVRLMSEAELSAKNSVLSKTFRIL